MTRSATSKTGLSTLVYGILLLLTIFTWQIGESTSGGFFTSTLVLIVAMLKGILIGDYFMQLKPVRNGWRYVVILWLLLPAGLIGSAFYISG